MHPISFDTYHLSLSSVRMGSLARRVFQGQGNSRFPFPFLPFSSSTFLRIPHLYQAYTAIPHLFACPLKKGSGGVCARYGQKLCLAKTEKRKARAGKTEEGKTVCYCSGVDGLMI